MNITQEKLDEFQGRMSNWVSSQGLLFQLTHGGSIQGAHSSVVMWFIRMVLRFLALVLVAVLIFWGYLVKRVDFSSFRAELNESIASGLGADETTAGGITRARGHLEISRMEMAGGETSFFSEAAVRGVRTKMGLVDGLLMPWNGESISIEELIMEVRAGAERDEVGREIFGRLFKQPANFKFSRVEASRATIRWGYSGVTRGEIKEARIRAVRQDGGWSVIVTGGLFSQNWLKQLEIERMEIAVRPEGVEILEARLKRGPGTVTFTAKVEGPATSPTLSGSGTMQGLSIDSYLRPELREFLGAEVSGDFEIGGSPYAASGVTLKVNIELQGEDVVELHNRLPLFKAISVVDRGRSYRNVRFTSGGFKMETGGRVAVFTDISLDAKETVRLESEELIEVPVMRLEGEFLVRRATKEEVDEALKPKATGKPDTLAPEPIEGAEELEVPKPKELTLREAAEAAREEGGEESTIDNLLLNARLGPGKDKHYKDEARDREERAPRLDGALRIGLNAKAFEKAPALLAAYPIDPKYGLRWLELPLKGSLFRVDSDLADEILEHSATER